MSAAEWAGFAVAIMTLVAGFTAAIRWIVQKFRDAVRWLVEHYLAELKPNGGGSMRDAVNINTQRLERVETEQSRQSTRIDDIYKILCEIKGK
jgi:hypothetical protein